MRLIGQVPTESAARCFSDYLFVQGIDNQLEPQHGEGWAIWVNDEDKLEEASRLLAAFQANPSDARYQSQTQAAAQLRASRAKQVESYTKRVRDRSSLFRPINAYGFGPLSFVLIVLSVGVFLLCNLPNGQEVKRVLSIADYSIDGMYLTWQPGLAEVRHGQLWRLLTPIFLHFGLIHIFFNMLWLRDLGSMIEGRQSSRFLALFVVVIAVGSNVAQFYFGHGPNFGGMSGVVYGLLGYIWIRGKLDPISGLYLHPTTVMMMIVWFFLCMTGLMGNIANYVHGVGLGMGMAWGYLASLRRR